MGPIRRFAGIHVLLMSPFVASAQCAHAASAVRTALALARATLLPTLGPGVSSVAGATGNAL